MSNNDGHVIINIDSNALKVAREFENLDNVTAKYEKILKSVEGTSNASLPVYEKLRTKLKEQQNAAENALSSFEKLANAQKSGIGFAQLNSLTNTAIERLKNLALQGQENSIEFQNLAKSVKDANIQINNAQNIVNNAITDKPAQKVSLLTSNFFKLKQSLNDFKNTGDVFSAIDDKLIKIKNGANSLQTGFKALSNTNISLNSTTIERKLKILQEESLRSVAAFEKLSNAAKSLTTFSNLNSQTTVFTERLKTLALRGQENSTEFNKMAAAVKNANRQMANAEAIVAKATGFEQLSGSIFNLNNVLGAFSVGYITNQIADLGKSVVNTSMDFQALENRMNAAASNKSVGADSLAYIRKEADRLGLSFKGTADSFAGFEAAALRSGLTLGQTKQIFTDISEAATSMQLPATNVELTFKALEQIAGKGTVSMEELRQQLGDHLPGAFEIAAKSMGMTTREFYDMVSEGKVLSSEFLPKFAAALKNELGGSALEASTQLRASINRLNTDLMDSSDAWGSYLSPSVQQGVETFRGAAQASTALAKTLDKNRAEIGLLTKSITTAVGTLVLFKTTAAIQTAQALNSTVISVSSLKKAIDALTVAASKNPLMVTGTIVATSIGAITYALQKNNAELSKSAQELRKLSQEITNNAAETPRLIAEYHNLASATKRTGEEDQRLYEIKEVLKKQTPGLLEQFGEELAMHKNISAALADSISQYTLAAKAREIYENTQDLEARHAKTIQQFQLLDLMSHGASKIFTHEPIMKAYKESAEAIDESTKSLRALIEQEEIHKKVIQSGKSLSDYTLGTGVGALGGSDGKGKDKKVKGPYALLQEAAAQARTELEDLAVKGITSGKVWDTQVAKVQNLENTLKRIKEATDFGVIAPFQSLNKQLQEAQEKVNNLAASKIVNIAELRKAKDNLTELQKKAQEVQIAAETSPFRAAQSQSSLLKSRYQDLAFQGLGNTAEALAYKRQFNELDRTIEKVNNSTANSVGLRWADVSRNISSQLSTALTTPLQQGENAFERFGNVAINVIQQIAQAWLSNKLAVMFSNSGGSKSLGDRFSGAMTGAAAGSAGGWWGAAAGAIGGFFKNADGNAFNNGRVIPFASGGVIGSPTMFPMAGGQTGLMGERGAEAIMPLKRASNGDLGVQAQVPQPNITIYNQSGANIETVKRPNGDTEIFIKKVNNALRNERTQSGFSSALQRNNSRGIQAS